MSILEVRNLKFGYTDQELYNSVSFDLNLGEHAVLVGPNGCGKSTFMKIIARKIIEDKGEVNWLKDINYSYLDQQLEVEKDMPINSYLYGVYNDLFKKEKELNEIYSRIGEYSGSELDRALNIAESMREYLEMNNFYNIETEINNVVIGLGLNRIDLDRFLSSLSGGEKMKVYLAKLLLEKPDCILMDEPTNFLDKAHVEWLIDYLNNYKGTFLVISHDQDFLKNIAKVVFAIEAKSINKYKGDYNYYLSERELRLSKQSEAYNRQQAFIKKTQEFIDKNIVRASTTKQAQSRRKMLEKIKIIEKPTTEYKPSINFKFSKELSQEVLKIKDLVIGYDKPLLPKFSIIIRKNERIEIYGKNGVGKTTFIKTILGELSPISGTYQFAPSVTINYLSQEEELDLESTPIDYIRIEYPLMETEKVLSTLAPLGIKGDLARKPLYELSGGELERVRIARLTLKKSNFLILDEPTNHLDKITKDELKRAIKEFPGSVLIISHEKGFLEDICNKEIKF